MLCSTLLCTFHVSFYYLFLNALSFQIGQPIERKTLTTAASAPDHLTLDVCVIAEIDLRANSRISQSTDAKSTRVDVNNIADDVRVTSTLDFG
jgi:hypothetical protein